MTVADDWIYVADDHPCVGHGSIYEAVEWATVLEDFYYVTEERYYVWRYSLTKRETVLTVLGEYFF